MRPRSDDALTCLMELPPAFRITVLALMGEADPLGYEESRIGRYIEAVTRFTEENRLTELMTQIETVEAQRRSARHFNS